jgi:acylphosphatase
VERWEVRFVGQVQGVGFRATTFQLASSFDVAGTVRNLTDGSVEMIAEGDAAELQRFLDAIRRRFAKQIRSEQIHKFPARGEAGFRVLR